MNQTFQSNALPQKATQLRCYHCDLPVIVSRLFVTNHEGQLREFCCAGCQAVTNIIEQGGFDQYYRLRQFPGLKPTATETDSYTVFDRSDMQTGWLKQSDDPDNSGNQQEAELLVDGITCSACVWLLESWLKKLPGVSEVYVNLSTFRLTIRWAAAALPVSEIFRQIHSIGYRAKPYSQVGQLALLDQQRKALLKRLGVAAAFGMQIMVLSIALYSGNWFGMEPEIRSFLTRVNLLLVLPVVFYCAKPFFTGALRNIRLRSAGMDLPVSLGIGLAFFGSVWATISGNGEVYFDSIAMFVFFLLGARYLELAARLKGNSSMEHLASANPEIAHRLNNSNDLSDLQTVPASELITGDKVVVKPGEVTPADGVINRNTSTFDESLLTGEHRPVKHAVGDKVLAGSINIDQAVTITVTQDSNNSVLASILDLASRSSQDKPRISVLAEQVASYFVMAVVLIAAVIAGFGIATGQENWLSTTIAVLVVTCPCALSLATPLTLTAATNSMMKKGIYIAKQHAIETLSQVTQVIFDKTGTLTNGALSITKITPYGEATTKDCLSIAAALEAHSNHPIAQAIVSNSGALKPVTAQDIQQVVGLGVKGKVNQIHYYLGSLALLESQTPQLITSVPFKALQGVIQKSPTPLIILASDTGILATIELNDTLRSGAQGVVQYLDQQSIKTSMCTGDRQAPAKDIADKLGITSIHAEYLPEQKLALLEAYINNGEVVAMAGDGINDTPALSKAHLAIALAQHINLSSANADVLLTNHDLSAIKHAHQTAKKAIRIVKQNIAWALLYNACAVPAAILGYVPPWLAGIGMSLSSIVVVLNASRLNTLKD